MGSHVIDMQKTSLKYIDGTDLEPQEMSIVINDPLSLRVLKSIPSDEKTEFVQMAVNIGIVALDTATKQAEAIRLSDMEKSLQDFFNSTRVKMSNDLGTILENYFDPTSGKFEQRIDLLINGKDGGELGRLLETQLRGADSPLQKVLDDFLGPKSSFSQQLEITKRRK